MRLIRLLVLLAVLVVATLSTALVASAQASTDGPWNIPCDVIDPGGI